MLPFDIAPFECACVCVCVCGKEEKERAAAGKKTKQLNFGLPQEIHEASQ